MGDKTCVECEALVRKGRQRRTKKYDNMMIMMMSQIRMIRVMVVTVSNGEMILGDMEKATEKMTAVYEPDLVHIFALSCG